MSSVTSDRPTMSERVAPQVSTLRVALVRGPNVSAYARAHGFAPTIVDAIGEGLNSYWSHPDHPGYTCQGLTVEQVLARMPRDVDVVGFSAMFSGEWPVQR